jgi:hypothetical protein
MELGSYFLFLQEQIKDIIIIIITNPLSSPVNRVQAGSTGPLTPNRRFVQRFHFSCSR